MVRRWSSGLVALAKYRGSFWSCNRGRGLECESGEATTGDEGRRAESRTRFKRKVLRVNGAEVMPRSQQQQPPALLLLFAACLPLPRSAPFLLFRSFPDTLSHPVFPLSRHVSFPLAFSTRGRRRRRKKKGECYAGLLFF